MEKVNCTFNLINVQIRNVSLVKVLSWRAEINKKRRNMKVDTIMYIGNESLEIKIFYFEKSFQIF